MTASLGIGGNSAKDKDDAVMHGIFWTFFLIQNFFSCKNVRQYGY